MEGEGMAFPSVRQLTVNFADSQGRLKDLTLSLIALTDQYLEVDTDSETYLNFVHEEALQALAEVRELNEGLADIWTNIIRLILDIQIVFGSEAVMQIVREEASRERFTPAYWNHRREEDSSSSSSFTSTEITEWSSYGEDINEEDAGGPSPHLIGVLPPHNPAAAAWLAFAAATLVSADDRGND